MDKNEGTLRSLHGSDSILGAIERFDLSLRATSDLTRYAAQRPGKKIVIFVSPGWPILIDLRRTDAKAQKSTFRAIVEATTQLRDARVTLCNADASGPEGGVYHATAYDPYAKGVRSWQDAQPGHLSLQILALQSGGRVLTNSNDVASEIATCVADANAYYILTFDPLPADGPDDYHAIEVKMPQRQWKAQTRAGYYAQPDAR